MFYAVLILLIVSYVIYGIAQVLKEKTLSIVVKITWIIIIIVLPVLGTAGYLRTSFKERHGRW
jgi:predicted ABC-type exoprotein transport system permease subunit